VKERTVERIERSWRAGSRGLSWSQIASQLNAWRTPTGQGGVRVVPEHGTKAGVPRGLCSVPDVWGSARHPWGNPARDLTAHSPSRTVPTWR
jgi:hypothetical protein